MEDKIGSIEVGKYADIAVWNKDLYTIPTDEIKDLKCQLTLIGGKIVYKAPDTPVTISKGKVTVSQRGYIGSAPFMVFALLAIAIAAVVQIRRKVFKIA